MSPTSYQTAPPRVRGRHSTVLRMAVKRLNEKEFFIFVESVCKTLDPRLRVADGIASVVGIAADIGHGDVRIMGENQPAVDRDQTVE